MHITPAQMAVYLICGHDLPRGRKRSLMENMKDGRAMLVRLAGVDYGYDLQRWHDHLKSIPRAESSGYTWNRTIVLPKVMENALASEEWRIAARELVSGT